MTLDSYKVILIRRNGQDKHIPEVTYNGRKVVYPSSTNRIIDEMTLGMVRVLTSNPNINRLEMTVSGEDLK